MEPRPAKPERRQLTVLFCDMVGSTSLSSHLDPEDFRDLIRVYQQTCTREIERFGGIVTRYVGDGILALFGYPQAHEDDAERAISSAIAIVDQVATLHMEFEDTVGISVAVRVGISTGKVVAGDLIGEGVSEEAAVVGETPNLAARLQHIAAPNTVVVHSSTKELAGAHFDYVDLGARYLRGFAGRVRAWQVVRRRAGRSRFEAAHPTNLTPLVGRDAELLTLLRRWGQAVRGEGQVVLLTGESGIGKSRIAQALDEQLGARDHERLRYQCSSYHQDSALHPFIEQLEWAAGLATADIPTEKLEKLARFVERSGLEIGSALPVLAALLSIPDDSSYMPTGMSPWQRKKRTLGILVDRYRRIAAVKPLLLILEDLQWADPTSLELMELIVNWVRSKRVLVVVTYRPGFEPPWKNASHVTEIALERLSAEDAARLAAGVKGGETLPSAFIEEIVAKTDGVPLFIEEVTRAVQANQSAEEGTQPQAPLSVPPTLQDILAARLDQMGSAKELAQLGAVIGRSFSHALLQATAGFPSDILEDGLGCLVDSGLLYREGQPPLGTYSFKHALVQDVAYEGLLRRKRRELHARVAEILESRFPEQVENQPEVVAHHYFEGARFLESARYWLLAGKAAIEHSANLEAAAHLRKALAALERLAAPAAAAELELPVQLNLGVALTASEGFASPSVEAAFARARELCAAAGNTPELFYALCGLGSFYTVRAELATAREVAQCMLDVGHETGNVDLLVWGNVATGVTELHSGEFEAARRHLHAGIGLYDPARHRAHAFVFGQDAGVIGRCHLAWTTWFMGEPEQAVEHMALAIDLAKHLSHPFSHAYALTFAAWLAQFRGESEDCRRSAEAAVASAKEHGFPLILGMALVVEGWSTLSAGNINTGLAAMRKGMTLYENTGAQLGRPAMLALLALGTAQSGDVAVALETLEGALAVAARHGEHFLEAELRRLTAELVLKTVEEVADPDRARAREQARRMAHSALEAASRQGARTLVLRAALTSLRTASPGRERAADIEQLTHICGQFEASAPLEELAMAHRLINEARPPEHR